MSNFIPMVSSSPPPMDDEKTSEWEEDDDDFGNFTGANESVSESDLNWSNVSTTPTSQASPVKEEVQKEDFADFKSFNKVSSIGPKPHVSDLPLVSNHENQTSLQNSDPSHMSESVDSLDLSDKNVIPSTLKRDSDSGMFSSDISPIPVSEEGVSEPEVKNCDQNINSIETKTDLTLGTPNDDDTCNNLSQSDEKNIDIDLHKDQEISMNSKTHVENSLQNGDESVCTDKMDGSISSKLDNLVDSDEEFDQFSSDVLHSISSKSAIEKENITVYKNTVSDGDNMAQFDANSAVKASESEEFGQDDEEFGDFADFSSMNQPKDDDGHSADNERADPNSLPDDRTDKPAVVQDEGGVCKTDLQDSVETDSDVIVHQDGHLSSEEKIFEDVKDLCQNSIKDDKSGKFALGEDANGCDQCDEDQNLHLDDCDLSASDVGPEATDNHDNTALQNDQVEEEEFADFSCADNKIPIQTDSQSNDLSDDDFADFSSAPANNADVVYVDDGASTDDTCDNKFKSVDITLTNTVGDDDNDFADFSSAKFDSDSAIKTQSSSMHNGTSLDNGDEEDFTDFSSADVQNSFGSISTSKNENDNWGNFSDNDDEEFGNFDKPVIKDISNLSQKSSVKIPDTNKLKTVLDSCFISSKGTQDQQDHIDLLDTLLKGSLYQHTKPNSHNTCENTIKKVLKHLRDYDNTNALLYQWKKSRNNNRLLKTLRIDTQNMLFGLKKQVVPLTVKNLTLLEPIRGTADHKKEHILANLAEPSSSDPASQLQDMPPVEFDWDNSGLTNPLEAKTLDLDFMVIQENESSNKAGDEWDWVFQSELLDAPRSSVKPMQPLEDILKNMKLSTTAPPTVNSQNENLSKEAGSIINSLPLLSFMKSKVLMFKLHNS